MYTKYNILYKRHNLKIDLDFSFYCFFFSSCWLWSHRNLTFIVIDIIKLEHMNLYQRLFFHEFIFVKWFHRMNPCHTFFNRHNFKSKFSRIKRILFFACVRNKQQQNMCHLHYDKKWRKNLQTIWFWNTEVSSSIPNYHKISFFQIFTINSSCCNYMTIDVWCRMIYIEK